MKLSFHPQTSDSDIGELLYNEVYRPDGDDVCTRSTNVYKILNTTAYGIHNITSTCNQSSLCIYFHEMSAPADGRVFSIDQICGVTLIHLENEYRFKFRLEMSTNLSTLTKAAQMVSSPTHPPTIYEESSTDPSTLTKNAGMGVHTVMATSTDTTPTEGSGRDDTKDSTGAVIGIVIAVIIIVAIALLFAVKYKLLNFFSLNETRGRMRNRTQTQEEQTQLYSSNIRNADNQLVSAVHV